ncbi:MAG: Uma2 family endonuclease [Pseudomonadota bacterium]
MGHFRGLDPETWCKGGGMTPVPFGGLADRPPCYTPPEVPMSEPARSPVSYDDVLQAPPEQVAEILAGELVLSPRPRSDHALAAGAMGADLAAFGLRRRGGGPGGWWILPEPELHLGPDVIVPDLAGWRRERMPDFPVVTAFTLVPDWVCEILSRGTARRDRGVKMEIYGRSGVVHVWLVDPAERLLEVYRRAEPFWARIGAWGDDARVRAEPFDAVELDLSGWWVPPPEAQP